MNSRRSFLRSLIVGGLAAAADPEKLLWVPGQKLISIPPPLVNASLLVYRKQALERLERKFVFQDFLAKEKLPKSRGQMIRWYRYSNVGSEATK